VLARLVCVALPLLTSVLPGSILTPRMSELVYGRDELGEACTAAVVHNAGARE